MAKRIELSFSADLPGPSHQDAYESSAGNIQDTAVLQADSDISEADRGENVAKLEELRVIGQHTVATLVKGLEGALGQELYPSKIVQDVDTTKVFLEVDREQRQPAEMEMFHPAKTKKSMHIYNITDGGEVNSSMFRHPELKLQAEDRMFVKFQTRFTKAPSVIVGLNYLEAMGPDLSKNSCWVVGNSEEIHPHLFEVHSETLNNFLLNGVGYTWLAVPTYHNPELQTGTIYARNETIITFKHPYQSPPKVIVWLNGLCGNYYGTSGFIVKVSTKDITSTGFKIQVATANGEWVSWFAYPTNTPGICSGNLQPTKGNAGVVTFDRPFAKAPRRILIALNSFQLQLCYYMQVRIVYEAVSERGMAVRAEHWGPWQQRIFNIGVSYIAME